MVYGYHDGGDAPDKQLELVPGAVREAEAFLAVDEETRARFDRFGTLVAGFEIPSGLELLSTVHWVASREDVSASDDVRAKVYDWNDRKKQFSPRQTDITMNALVAKKWVGQTAH